MELTALRYLREIARHGHMTRAAETIGVSQPALSAMLRKLETELGAELFHRTGRGVVPTEAGRVFIDHAEAALREAEAGAEAVRQLLGLERGSIRLGAGATAAAHLLPGVVSAFRRERPGLRFYIREAGSAAVAQAVLAGELDLGIVTLPLAPTGARDLMVAELAEDELRLITPDDHALAPKKSFRWRDLDAQPFVAFEAGSAVRAAIDRACADAGVALDPVMELRSIESIKRMVAAGVGVGFVSRFALAPDDGLTCRDGKLTRRLALVRRRDRVPSAATEAFEKALLDAAEVGE